MSRIIILEKQEKQTSKLFQSESYNKVEKSSTPSSSTTQQSDNRSDHTSASRVSSHGQGEGSSDIMWCNPLYGSPLEMKQKQQENLD